MASLRSTSAPTLLALMLALPGCYEGPGEIEGVPWDGDEEAVDEDAGDDGGNADDSGASDSAGGADSGVPTGDDSDTGPSDDDSGDPPDDSAGDDSAGDDSAGDDSAGDDSAGDDTGEDPPPPSDEVPDNAYCNGVADWDPAWTELENEILVIVNERRAEGANCGSAGSFGPAGPVTANPALRCAARVHSQDMVDRNFFDHTRTHPESRRFKRMGEAGYQYSTAGENIAAGHSTAAATMQQWMDSDGHCGNIMNDSFTELGVGYYPGGQYGHVWTQNFGAP